jgi:hypothetical protein
VFGRQTASDNATNEKYSPMKQNYANHSKYYYPHHFLFYPMIIALMGICFYFSFKDKSNQLYWIISGSIAFMLLWFSFMTRQHYGIGNQNRIIRLEMRLRYYMLTQKNFEAIEEKISFKQLTALRFAADDELLVLIDKTLQENLSPREIKQLVKNWKADHMRL